jgi:hypothetical protein
MASFSEFVKDNQCKKEWEEATSSICMEHPHTAILLICALHNNLR